MSEYIEQAIKFFTDKGVSRGLAIAYIAVCAALVVVAIVALVMRIIVIIKYQQANKMTASCGKNSTEMVRYYLDKEGLKDVKVAKASWFRALIFGNSYSLSKKTIFLRKGIYNKSSVTAIGVAMQKVGIAKLINSGDKAAITRNTTQVITLVGPILFIPLVLIGAIIDVILFHVFGVFSIVALSIGGLLILAGFVQTLLSIPVEKKANNMAMEVITKDNLLTNEEKVVIKRVFSAYMVAYVCEFIISVLRMVQLVLEIVMNVQISNNSK